MVSNPRVFISYSHDSSDHSGRVLALAKALRSHGIDVELDQFHRETIVHWPSWCRLQISSTYSDFVLCICTEEFHRRIIGQIAPDCGKGVYWEGRLLESEIYDAKGNSRIIPVLFDDASESCIPDFLHGWTFFRLRTFALSEVGYESLLRILSGQARTKKNELGQRPRLHPDSLSKGDSTSGSKEDSRWSKIEIPPAGALRGSSSLKRETPPIGKGAKVSNSNVGPWKRRLDAAVPSTVTVHVSFPLLVQVRFPGSDLIVIGEFPSGASPAKTSIEAFPFNSGQLVIEVEAPNCVFTGEKKKSVKVPRGEFSPMLKFLVTPESVGPLHIQVTARSSDLNVIGEVLVVTTVKTIVTDTFVQGDQQPINISDQSPPRDLIRINELVSELNLQLRLKHDCQMQAVGIRKIELEQEIRLVILPKITALDTELAVRLADACPNWGLGDAQSAQFVKDLASGANRLESALAGHPSLSLQRLLSDLLTTLGNCEMDSNAQLALAIPSIPETLGFETEYPALIHLRASWDRIRQFLIFRINQPSM